MSLNIRFSNCFDFINNMKEVIESNPDRWDNIYMEESIFHAEIDLMEMEIEAAHDAEKYDSIMETNVFRKGHNRKARQNGKRNTEKAKRLHNSDRKHGKNYLKRNNLQNLSMEDAEFFHDKKAMDIACHDGKWIYTGKHGDDFWSKVWYTRHKKNRNNRLDSAMAAREKDFLTN